MNESFRIPNAADLREVMGELDEAIASATEAHVVLSLETLRDWRVRIGRVLGER